MNLSWAGSNSSTGLRRSCVEASTELLDKCRSMRSMISPQRLVRLPNGDGFVADVRLADANGDVRQITPGGGLVAHLSLCMEPARVAGIHGIDKIAGVLGAGVALELAHDFAVRIVRGAAAASTGIVAAFAMNHIAAFHALILTDRSAIRFVGQIAHGEEQRDTLPVS